MRDCAGDVVILHLAPNDAGWAAVQVQFVLHMTQREGRAVAAWTAERLERSAATCHALVALRQDALAGIVLFEIVRDYAELTFPWLTEPNTALAELLIAATLQTVDEVRADVKGYRVERHLLPGTPVDLAPLERAGFRCYRRHRMLLDLPGYVLEDMRMPPGYRMTPWHIRYLDRAASMIYRANDGTLDAELYAPFFGDSPVRCRSGLLGILAGQYGAIHPRASQVLLHGHDVVGVNLILHEGDRFASVVEISIDPDHQGKGLGRLLMLSSLHMLQQEHFDQVELAVTADNSRAVRLYESLGFNLIDAFTVCVM